MYFEDEKDIIDDGTSLHIDEDGTVSWEDILSDNPDEQGDLGFDDAQNQSSSGGDELQFMDSDGAGNNDSEVGDIDYSDASTDSSQDISSQLNNDEAYSQDDSISDDFDIDKQLEQVSLDDDSAVAGDDSFKMPQRPAKKGNLTAVLLALLVAILVMGGIYYYFTNFQNSSGGDIVPPSTKTEMDNMTSEDLEQRQQQKEDQQEEGQGIPVVNDENVGEIKPEEPEVPEKKEVISVTPTGRINPFLPLQKYQKIELPETIVQYDKVGIPVPPTTMPKKNEEAAKMLTISVSGIMYDNVRPSAIITLDNNDYFVQKGDKLDNYRVIDIGRNYVTIAFGKNLYKANVGEEFKISSQFYGSAQYIPQGLGGGRQYYSVSSEGSSNSAKKSSSSSSSSSNISSFGSNNDVAPVTEMPPMDNSDRNYVSEEAVDIIAK